MFPFGLNNNRNKPPRLNQTACRAWHSLSELVNMVKTFFRSTHSFLTSTQTTILSAASILMISSLASAVLGIVRWRILFTYFGNSPELGLYLLADRIPSFIFTIIISGAFSLVFIPVLTRLLAHEKEQAYHLVSICFTTLFIAFTSLIILGIIFARPLCELLSVGTLTPDHLQTMVNLLRIMLVAQIGLVVSAFMSAYLQAHRNFVLPALAPLAYWGGYLIVLVALVNANHIYAAAYGMVVGSLLHLLVQLPHAIKLG